MSTKKIASLLFITLVIVMALEFYNLTAMALWHDEAFSALLIKYNFKEMMYRIGLDVHPPFYYIILRGWNFLFGNSLFFLRALSVFFGALAILAVYLFVKEAFNNRKFALFSSILFAFSSFQIQYAMEARMYPLGVFLVIASSYFLLRALKSKNWKYWLCYVFFAVCGIYTHYYIFFSLLAQGIFLLYWIFRKSKFKFSAWLSNKDMKFALISYLLIVLSYIPWLNVFFRQIGQVEKNYWIPKINIWTILASFLKLTTGTGIDAPRFWYIVISLALVIFAVIIFFLSKNKNSLKWFVFLLFIVPFLASIGVSIKRSIFLDRYFIFVLPFYSILITGAILAIKNKLLKNILISVAILGTLISFPIYWTNLKVTEKPGMKGAADYLNQQVQPNEKIYVGSSFVYFTFKYYNQTGIYPLLYVPGPLAHFSGTALLSESDTIKNFNKEVEKKDIVWLINTTGFGGYQPSAPDNWKEIEEKGFEDVCNRGWIIATKYQVK